MLLTVLGSSSENIIGVVLNLIENEINILLRFETVFTVVEKQIKSEQVTSDIKLKRPCVIHTNLAA